MTSLQMGHSFQKILLFENKIGEKNICSNIRFAICWLSVRFFMFFCWRPSCLKKYSLETFPVIKIVELLICCSLHQLLQENMVKMFFAIISWLRGILTCLVENNIRQVNIPLNPKIIAKKHFMIFSCSI